jgi:glycosyltransferase involved in cell wall biosynthesis
VWTLPCTTFSPTPTVLTMHGRLDLEHVVRTLPLYPDVALVSISDHQRTPLAGTGVTWAATIHNGLDLSEYRSSRAVRGDHLLFVGRISPEKGPAAAVEVARRCGRALVVAAKVDPVDVEYHRTCIEPLFASNPVRFVGEVGEPEKPALFGAAAATLFPSDWPEPFGLVMIESMAAGTPVIALRRGAVPEVVVDGVTGFVCDTVDDMVAAVGRLDAIDPEDCRRHAATFDAETMARGYLSVYHDVVAPSASTSPVAG